MATRPFDPGKLDMEAFAAAAAQLEGQRPLREFPRIRAVLHMKTRAPEDEPVVWSARGELRKARGAPAQVWLHLNAAANLALECQRCLSTVDVPVNVERRFLFVASEDEAAALDAESDDDILALTRWLNLHDLVEDELLLALPLVPRHERCPAPLPFRRETANKISEHANPFAALAELKRNGPVN